MYSKQSRVNILNVLIDYNVSLIPKWLYRINDIYWKCFHYHDLCYINHWDCKCGRMNYVCMDWNRYGTIKSSLKWKRDGMPWWFASPQLAAAVAINDSWIEHIYTIHKYMVMESILYECKSKCFHLLGWRSVVCSIRWLYLLKLYESMWSVRLLHWSEMWN